MTIRDVVRSIASNIPLIGVGQSRRSIDEFLGHGNDETEVRNATIRLSMDTHIGVYDVENVSVSTSGRSVTIYEKGTDFYVTKRNDDSRRSPRRRIQNVEGADDYLRQALSLVLQLYARGTYLPTDKVIHLSYDRKPATGTEPPTIKLYALDELKKEIPIATLYPNGIIAGVGRDGQKFGTEALQIYKSAAFFLNRHNSSEP